MLKEHLQRMYDFTCWGRDLIVEKAKMLTPEQFDMETRFPIHTVKETLVHTMAAERIYRIRLAGEPPAPSPEKGQFADLQAICTYWKSEEALMRDYLASVPEGSLGELFKSKNIRGEEFERVRLDVITQLFFHSMQHRSELAQMVTEFGHSPGDIDYMIYLASKK